MPHAVVVGIDRYSADRIPSLKYAVNDAEEVSRRLESAGFKVVTLTNEAATRQGIHWELEVGLNQRIVDEGDPILTDLRENADSGRSGRMLGLSSGVRRPISVGGCSYHFCEILFVIMVVTGVALALATHGTENSLLVMAAILVALIIVVRGMNRLKKLANIFRV